MRAPALSAVSPADRRLLNPRRRGRPRPEGAGEAERRLGRSWGLQWSRSPEQQPRQRRGLERLNAARPGPPAPEPGEPLGRKPRPGGSRRRRPLSPAQARGPPRPPVVVGPRQEELGPGGEARDSLRAAGVGGHPARRPPAPSAAVRGHPVRQPHSRREGRPLAPPHPPLAGRGAPAASRLPRTWRDSLALAPFPPSQPRLGRGP